MSRTMVTRRLGNLLILRQSAETPTDPEWDACLELLPENVQELERMRGLVVTDGGGPTAEQRRRLQRAIKGVAMPIAVVSNSIRIRFIASSVALLTSRIKSFGEDEYEAALVYLGIDTDERRVAERNLAEMTAIVRKG